MITPSKASSNDMLHLAAIRLLVFENRIEIINPGRLYGGLEVQDIMLGASKQRNPLMASFAERTMIYRGLGSGIVRVMKENVMLDFINEEDANQFRVIIWRTTQKAVIAAQKAEFATQKSLANTESATQKPTITTQNELSTTPKTVLEFFRNKPKGTRAEAAKAIPELTEDGVKYIIGKLQQFGLLKREGGRKDGRWVVTN